MCLLGSQSRSEKQKTETPNFCVRQELQKNVRAGIEKEEGRGVLEEEPLLY